MREGGQRKRLRTTKQTTPKYTADKSPGTSPRTGSGKRVSGTELGAVVTEVTYQTEAVRVTGLVEMGKTSQEAGTQTDAATPGQGAQSGWLNLPHNALNPFPPVEPTVLLSLRAVRRCRAATDIGYGPEMRGRAESLTGSTSTSGPMTGTA